jgi:hypothetical protein
MLRFFLNQNDELPIVAGETSVVFDRIQFFTPTASWWSVIATDDKKIVEALGKYRGRISEIDEADYTKLLARKKLATPKTAFLMSNPIPTVDRAMAAKPTPVVTHDVAAILTPKKSRK